MAQKKLLGNVSELALNSAHGLAFHRGLGTPLLQTSSTPLNKYLSEASIEQFAQSAYSKSNIAVVANGASQAELTKWVGEFFTGTPSSTSSLSSEATKYYGGEERIAHASGNSFVIAFPGSSSFTAGGSYKPEIAVLAALLGGKSSIKWSPGFSILGKAASSFPGASATTTSYAYSDAGLLTIQFSGSASAIRNASAQAITALKDIAEGSVSKEDFTKAVALAKYQALEEGQNIEAGLVSTGAGLVHGGKAFQIDEVGKSVESVTVDKLKAVSVDCNFDSQDCTNINTGCKGVVGGQGHGVGSWRSLCPAVRGGDWTQGISDFQNGYDDAPGLYQQLVECTVDMQAISTFHQIDQDVDVTRGNGRCKFSCLSCDTSFFSPSLLLYQLRAFARFTVSIPSINQALHLTVTSSLNSQHQHNSPSQLARLPSLANHTQ